MLKEVLRTERTAPPKSWFMVCIDVSWLVCTFTQLRDSPARMAKVIKLTKKISTCFSASALAREPRNGWFLIALVALNRIMALDHRGPSCHTLLINVFKKNPDHNMTRAHYNKHIKYDPSDPGIRIKANDSKQSHVSTVYWKVISNIIAIISTNLVIYSLKRNSRNYTPTPTQKVNPSSLRNSNNNNNNWRS